MHCMQLRAANVDEFHWRDGFVDDLHRREIGAVDGMAPAPIFGFPAPAQPVDGILKRPLRQLAASTAP